MNLPFLRFGLPVLLGCLLFLFSSAVHADPAPVIDLPTTNPSYNNSDFGTFEIGIGDTHNFRVQNLGDSSLTIYSVTISGPQAGEFSMFGTLYLPANLLPSEFFYFDVSFAPVAGGARAATVTITSNDPVNPTLTVPLSGYATPDYPTFVIKGGGPGSPDIPDMAEASSSLGTIVEEMDDELIGRGVTIANTGGTPLTITGASLSGADAADFIFFTDTFPVVLNRNEITILAFFYDPSVSGDGDAEITVTYGSSGFHTFSIKGVAKPVAKVKTASSTIPPGSTTPSITNDTDFDVAMVTGEQVVSTYTVLNEGSFPLNISSITKSGTHSADFTIGGITTPLTLGRGESTTFTLTFDPSAIGTRSATITVNSDDLVNGAYSFAVQGRGANVADLDPGFNPNANEAVHTLVLQPDGKAVVAGYFSAIGGASRSRVARFDVNSALDSGFDPDANTSVYCAAVQPDGKIIIGGLFTNVGGTARGHIARINANGTLDTGFDPDANNTVHAIALQPDGKIVIAGEFTNIGGTTRNRIARLNSDGSLDTGFNPNANNFVYSLALQTDGKILMAGALTSVGGTTRDRIARLNTDGSTDTGFTASATDLVRSLCLQTDGKVVIGGYFGSVNGASRPGCARLNTDGTTDTSFMDPDINGNVYGLSLDNAAKVFVYGVFTNVQSTTRNRIARLENNLATEALGATSSSRIAWLRGGSAPETEGVTFELSTNGGSTWSSLGAGTRISGGWEITGLSLPGSGHIRARAQTRGGRLNGSTSLIETTTAF